MQNLQKSLPQMTEARSIWIKILELGICLELFRSSKCCNNHHSVHSFESCTMAPVFYCFGFRQWVGGCG